MRAWQNFPAILVLACAAAMPLMNAQESAVHPAFEVASVKPNTSGAPMVRIFSAPGNPRFTATNISLRTLITFAWNVKNFEVLGGGGEIAVGRYDIEAKAANPKPTLEQNRSMVQGLLADRFKVIVHRETKEVPIYTLVTAKGGTRITQSKEGGCTVFDPASTPPPPASGRPPRIFCGLPIGPNIAKGGEVSMIEFVDGLSNILGRPVIDKTGYTGTFDVALEFSQEGLDVAGLFGGAPFIVGKPQDDESRPSIFAALQEHLGLKLESQKGPWQVLVIDNAEKASGN